jgi:hypothetical protein
LLSKIQKKKIKKRKKPKKKEKEKEKTKKKKKKKYYLSFPTFFLDPSLKILKLYLLLHQLSK